MKIQTKRNTIEISTTEVIAALAVSAITIWATASVCNNLITSTTSLVRKQKKKKYRH